MNTLKIGTLLIFLCSTTSGIAASSMSKMDDEQRNPLGCKNVGYQFSFNVLELIPGSAGEPQALYFLYNKLDQPINLFHMPKIESTSVMYLNHMVRPKQWAVISTSERYLKYICSVEDGKTTYGKVVDCSQSVKVCEFARVKYGLNNRGNYWLVGSGSRNAAVSAVIHYGIIPR